MPKLRVAKIKGFTVIKIKRAKYKNAEQIDQINRSNIVEGYNGFTITIDWV